MRSRARRALRAIRDQAQTIQTQVGSAERPGWLDANPHDAAPAAAEDVFRREFGRFRDGLPLVDACKDLGQLCGPVDAADGSAQTPGELHRSGSPDSSGGTQDPSTLSASDITVTVLVSRSLGAAQLKEIFALAADTPGVRVAFRGVAEDEPLVAFLTEVHGLLAGLEPVPEVVLDPTPFRAAGVDIAPVLVATGPNGELARVAGLADPQWLRTRVLAGERGDLGVQGPVRTVSEPDLIEELHRRLAALDLGRLREQALARYWGRVAFEELPVATEARTRTIDPTLTAAADVQLSDGTLAGFRGYTAQPARSSALHPGPGGVRRHRSAPGANRGRLGRGPVSGGCCTWRRVWSGTGRLCSAVEDSLDSPVYLLTPEVRARFALERVPATVEAQGLVFVVAEVPPE